MKYDGGRLQDVFACFKTSLHENIKINILYQSLTYLYSFFFSLKSNAREHCKVTSAGMLPSWLIHYASVCVRVA